MEIIMNWTNCKIKQGWRRNRQGLSLNSWLNTVSSKWVKTRKWKSVGTQKNCLCQQQANNRQYYFKTNIPNVVKYHIMAFLVFINMSNFCCWYIAGSEGLLIRVKSVFFVRDVNLNCPSCKNDVFANLENGSSQCTRCGWITQSKKTTHSG